MINARHAPSTISWSIINANRFRSLLLVKFFMGIKPMNAWVGARYALIFIFAPSVLLDIDW